MRVNSKLSYLYSFVKMLFFYCVLIILWVNFQNAFKNLGLLVIVYSLDLLHCKHSRYWSVSLIQEDDITQFLFCEQYVWVITRPFIRENHWIALHARISLTATPQLVTENQSTRLQRTLNKIDKVGNFKSDLLKTNKDTAMQSRGILQTFVLYCGEHVPAFKLG